MPILAARPLRLFVSFAPEDRELKDELLKHLAVLRWIGKIEPWNADRFQTGDEWRRAIANALSPADVAVLLISADFLASDFILDEQVPQLIERRKQGGLLVLPIIVRSCIWRAHPWLGSLDALPRSGRAISSHSGNDRDQAWAQVASEMARLAGVQGPTGGTLVPKDKDVMVRKRRGVLLQ